MDFSYKKSGTVFNMHSYWTKQPIDPIKFFIEKNTNVGDVVYDPFSGTGMTGVASILTNRRCILNDLSCVSTHIAKGYCTNFKAQKNAFELLDLKNKILNPLKKYYSTTCTSCDKEACIRFGVVSEIWQSKDGSIEEDRGDMMLKYESSKFTKGFIFKEFRLIKICYKCSCSKEKRYKTPDKADLLLWSTEDYKKFFYPKDNFFGQEPKRNYKKGIRQVYQLYSPKNLTVLSQIFDSINKIADKNTKQLFLFVFTSILFNSSLMSRYRDYENTSIKMGTFYIAPVIKDTNVINNFESKFLNIIKGNSEIFKNGYDFEVNFFTESADNVPSIKNDSVDYIYTDPPYSDILNYSELNIVYEAWLGKKTNNSREMIVNKEQGLSIETYAKQFEQFFLECYRVLKNNKIITLVFHHPNIDHWRYIQKAIINSNFEPIISDEPIRLISNSKTSSQHQTKKNTQCFLIFNFKKNNKQKIFELKKINSETDLKNIINEAKLNAEKAGFFGKADMFDYIINYLIFRYEIVDFTNLL